MNEKKSNNYGKKTYGSNHSGSKTSGTKPSGSDHSGSKPFGSFGKNKGKSFGKSTNPSGRPGFIPDYKKKKPKKGAQQGDYVIISDGKKKVTSRINLPSHPFAKKEVGDMVLIKGVEWYLIRIIQQGTAAYNKLYDSDTQREHFGY